ncbi:hypothetical protein KC19_5G172700 [Ceratodon purpureus]|uniref:Uncharacterized protein n=1 Tax=Ceratodon purpureus TaxID=3225 RepID=A0A8T0I4L0_CERPU|nr:hypothetical protein KC19_5G172700 [Ceratodon purpureus]
MYYLLLTAMMMDSSRLCRNKAKLKDFDMHHKCNTLSSNITAMATRWQPLFSSLCFPLLGCEMMGPGTAPSLRPLNQSVSQAASLVFPIFYSEIFFDPDPGWCKIQSSS